MIGLRWYAHELEKYAKKTAHLTILQHGAYRLLLDHIYRTGGPLPADLPSIHRVCRAESKADKQAISFVLAEFFKLHADGWHNKTADEELQKAAALTEKKSQAGQSGNRKRWADRSQSDRTCDDDVIANASTLTTTNTITEESKEESKKTPKPPHASRSVLNGSSELFRAFYETFPLHKSRRAAEKAYISALKRASPEQILIGAQRYAADPARKPEFTKHPASWLNADGWLDEAANAKPNAVDELVEQWRKEAENGQQS